MYSYELDAAGGLLNPQALEGAHLQRKSVYLSFTGEYSKVNFLCCRVIDGDELHMPKVLDASAPFVLRVDTGALPDDGGLQRELYAELFDSSGDSSGHSAYWTLEPAPTSPVMFDDGGAHTIDYTINSEVVAASRSTLNLVTGADVSRVDLQQDSKLNVYDGKLGYLFIDSGSGGNFDILDGVVERVLFLDGYGLVSGGAVNSIYFETTKLNISGGTIGELMYGWGTSHVTGGTFNGDISVGFNVGCCSSMVVTGGKFNAPFFTGDRSGIVFYGDLKLSVLDYGPGGATFSVAGTLLDGTYLEQIVHSRCETGATDENPCPGGGVTVNP